MKSRMKITVKCSRIFCFGICAGSRFGAELVKDWDVFLDFGDALRENGFSNQYSGHREKFLHVLGKGSPGDTGGYSLVLWRWSCYR